MPVDTGPINSVIQSWLQSNQQGLEAKRMQQEKDIAEQQLEFQKEQLAQHHEMFGKTLDFQQRLADTAKAFQEMELHKQFNEQYGNTGATPVSNLPPPAQNNVSTTGNPVNPISFSPSSVPQQQPYTPTPEQGYTDAVQKAFPGQKIDPNYNQQQLERLRAQGDVQAEIAGKVKGAEAAGAFPYEEQLQQPKLIATWAEKMLALQERAQEHKDTIQSKEMMLRMVDDTKRYLGGLSKNKNVPDAEELMAAVDNIGLGKGKFDAGINGLHEKALAKRMGISPLDPKKADALGALQGLNTVFDNMKALIPMLSDSKAGAFGQKLQTNLPVPSDLKTRTDEILQQLPGLTRQLSGLGMTQKLNIVELSHQLRGTVLSGNRKIDAQHKLTNLYTEAYRNIMDDTLGGLSFEQKVHVLEDRDLITSLEGRTIKVGGQETPLVVKKPDGSTFLFDVDKGKYGQIRTAGGVPVQ